MGHNAVEKFSRRVSSYDEQSDLQKQVAGNLSTYFPALKPKARILEIGCGTGHLTEHIFNHYAGKEIIISDKSHEMVKKCQSKFSDQNAHFVTLDGENVQTFTGDFDLIVSSMVIQWFVTPSLSLRALTDYLKPNGQLLVATLDEGYFPEWRAALDQAKVENGLIPAPKLPIEMERHQDKQILFYKNASGFLRQLKETGASTSKEGYQPQYLRKAMRAYNDQFKKGETTWHIQYGLWQK